MNRRDFLSAVSGSLALSIVGTTAGTTSAQWFGQGRTIHETAAERLLQVYSYVPNTPEYEALALGDALWSDISKQYDAFGYRHSRADYHEQERGTGHFSWLTLGNDPTGNWSDPGRYVYVPPLAADQFLRMGESDFPQTVTIFTGIDVAIPASIFNDKGYAATSIVGGTLYIHADQAVVKDITWNRFAVLLDEGVLAWFNSEESAQHYASWKESGESSLADSEVLREQLALAQRDAITYAWVDGSRLNRDGSAKRVLGDYASAETLEAYRDQLRPAISLEDQLFGRMPQIHSLLVGCDAGASLEPEPVVSGYDVPQGHVKLQFGSDSDAHLAAEIIEWRMKNARSFVTREVIDFEPFQPLPIDTSEAHEGVLIQRFEEPYMSAHRIRGMMLQFDLAIYGWGEFS